MHKADESGPHHAQRGESHTRTMPPVSHSQCRAPLALLLLAAALGVLAGPARSADAERSAHASPRPAPALSPELRSLLAQSSADAAVPFVAVMCAQSDALRLRVEADRLRLEGRGDEGRRHVIDALQGIAAASQGPVLGLLQAAQRALDGRLQG